MLPSQQFILLVPGNLGYRLWDRPEVGLPSASPARGKTRPFSPRIHMAGLERGCQMDNSTLYGKNIRESSCSPSGYSSSWSPNRLAMAAFSESEARGREDAEPMMTVESATQPTALQLQESSSTQTDESESRNPSRQTEERRGKRGSCGISQSGKTPRVPNLRREATDNAITRSDWWNAGDLIRAGQSWSSTLIVIKTAVGDITEGRGNAVGAC